MLSLRSCSAEVMNRLTPSMCHEPSACSIALVRPAPTSEPASGSVSTMVEPQWWSIISWASCFWAALPISYIRAANAGPLLYMCTAGLAPSTISTVAQYSDRGATRAAELLGQAQAPPLGRLVGGVGLLETGAA